MIDFFIDENSIKPTIVNTREEFAHAQSDFEIDFCDVKGQENIKRHWKLQQQAAIMQF